MTCWPDCAGPLEQAWCVCSTSKNLKKWPAFLSFCHAWIHVRHQIFPPGQKISGCCFCTSCQRITSRVKYLSSHQMSEERNTVVPRVRRRLCPLRLYIFLKYFFQRLAKSWQENKFCSCKHVQFEGCGWSLGAIFVCTAEASLSHRHSQIGNGTYPLEH